MASYALIEFKINNNFSEWEQAFYGAQPMARKAGLIELFHGLSNDGPQTCFVLMHVPSKEAMDAFFAECRRKRCRVRTYSCVHRDNDVNDVNELGIAC